MSEFTFIYRPSSLPAPQQDEFALMGAVVIQFERMSQAARERVLAYLSSLYGVTP